MRAAAGALLLLSGLSGFGQAWEQQPGYRRLPLNPTGDKAGFTLMTNAAIGIHWKNVLPPEKYIERQNLMNGAGVALGDFDGDGRCDIFLCNKFGPSGLFRNLGNWEFDDVTSQAGVACTNQISTGALFGDVNGDGRLDLLVTSFTGPNALFINQGQGHFTNATEQAGLISKGGSTSMALSDVDGDGDLDLYVNYFGVEAILRDGAAVSTRMVRGQPVVMGRFAKRLTIVNGQLVEWGEPDVLYENNGKGVFKALPWEERFADEQGKPVSAPADFGLAVQIRDINDDGSPDIYTCNDFQTPDRLWLGDGKGKFRAAPKLAFRNISYASMGVDFADIDRDGRLDFFTVEMLSREHKRHIRQSSPRQPTLRAIGQFEDPEDVARNVLFWNRGDGTYADIAWFSGVAASDWSWRPVFMDVDLDGYEDLLVTNGHLHDVNDRDMAANKPPPEAQRTPEARRLLLKYPRLDTPNAAWRNRGDLTFESASESWNFDSRLITHGMALADLDDDGDLDLVGNAANEGPLIYRNNANAARVAVRLRGKPGNVQGIGARVSLTGGKFTQGQEFVSGGRYLSGDDPIRVFAVAPGSEQRLEITWRSGERTLITGVKPNSL